MTITAQMVIDQVKPLTISNIQRRYNIGYSQAKSLYDFIDKHKRPNAETMEAIQEADDIRQGKKHEPSMSLEEFFAQMEDKAWQVQQ